MGADQRADRSTAPGLEISSVTRVIRARQAHSYSEWHAMAWTDQTLHPANYITAAAKLVHRPPSPGKHTNILTLRIMKIKQMSYNMCSDILWYSIC